MPVTVAPLIPLHGIMAIVSSPPGAQLYVTPKVAFQLLQLL
jgi:hypothetical protein